MAKFIQVTVNQQVWNVNVDHITSYYGLTNGTTVIVTIANQSGGGNGGWTFTTATPVANVTEQITQANN
jgi:hypothetical protein